MISLAEALALYPMHVRPLRMQAVPLQSALGHVLRAPVQARCDLPRFSQSALDGYVMTADSAAAPGRLAITASIAAGDSSELRGLLRGECQRILTGARVPPNAGAVIAQERVELAEGHIRFSEPLKPGAIYNSNRFTLRGLLENLGCDVADYGIVPDSLAATRETLRKAAEGNDLIITSGGVSVGEEDHIKPAVEAEGRLNMWQIAIKPGKPLAFGEIDRAGKPGAFFLGLPGNPVSSFVTFLLFVRPFILRMQGVADVLPKKFAMRADFAWPKADKRNEFLRARINANGGLDLFPNQSSAVLTSTVWGDGLVDNPSGRTIAAGDMVAFMPFSELLY